MIHEHDLVVLTKDLPDVHLKTGAVGAVVHIHEPGVAYLVEFVTPSGGAPAVVSVQDSQVRSAGVADRLPV